MTYIPDPYDCDPRSLDDHPRKTVQAPAKKWKCGDVVHLKSGGPSMTVEQYDESGNYPVFGVLCVWFPGRSMIVQRQVFKEDVLEAVEEKKP